MALDESTDLSGTSQLLMATHTVNLDFYVTDKLASVYSMHYGTNGRNIFTEMQKTDLQWNRHSCVNADGGKRLE